VAPGKSIVVGDAPNDILMGKRAHTQTAAVLTGHLRTKAEAAKYEPDFTVRDIFEFEEQVLKKRKA
jgi:phosphoglycolate phosphatase-like HAD superfamily hydrolase